MFITATDFMPSAIAWGPTAVIGAGAYPVGIADVLTQPAFLNASPFPYAVGEQASAPTLFKRASDFAATIPPEYVAAAVSLIYLLAAPDSPSSQIENIITGGLIMAGARTASPSICDHRGRRVRIREEGVEINGNVTPFYQVAVVKGKQSMDEWTDEGEEVVARFRKMLDDIERHGSYEASLKFILLLNNGDETAETYFCKLMQWTPGQLIHAVNSQYERIFSSAPPLPTEHGIWTEFATAYKKFGDGGSNALALCDMIFFFIMFPEIDVKYSENSIKFGPVALTDGSMLKIFSCSVDKLLEWCKSRGRLATRMEKEIVRDNEPINKRGRIWLDRRDIPEGLKNRLAVSYFHARTTDGNDIVRLFKDDVFMNRSAEEAEPIVNALYDKHVRPRKMGVKPATENPVPVKKEEPKDWKIIPFQMFADPSYTQGHNRSYTIFKRLGLIVDLLKLGTQTMRKIFNDDELAPETLRFRAEAEELMQFAKDPAMPADIRAMVVDLSLLISDRQTMTTREIYKIISRNRGNQKQLAFELRQLYKKEVPYADALFAKLEEERKALDSPDARAEKLLQRMDGEPDSVRAVWARAQSRCPSGKLTALIRAMKSAVSATNVLPEIYRPWIEYGLSSLSHLESDWKWLDDEPESPYQTVRYLQDLAYPIGGKFSVKRPQIDRTALDFIREDETWQRFVSAVSFLTPYEWKNLIKTLSDIHTETRKASRSFRSRHPQTPLPDTISERGRVLNAEHFSKELEVLLSAMNGWENDQDAILMRRVLRLAQNNRAFLYSLLRLALSEADSGQLNGFKYALSLMDKLLKKDVAGDIADIAGRMAFSKTPMERQGARAEYDSILRHANAGSRVRILTPDISMQRPMPDLLIESRSGEVMPVEVKSRRLTAEYPGEIRSALVEASNQLADKINRTPDTEKGVIDLYLIGNGGGNPAEADILEFIGGFVRSPDVNAPFDKVRKINIYFVDAHWNLTSQREISI